MENEKDLIKGTEECKENEESVEGYSYCDSHKERCLNDCSGSPFISVLN